MVSGVRLRMIALLAMIVLLLHGLIIAVARRWEALQQNPSSDLTVDGIWTDDSPAKVHQQQFTQTDGEFHALSNHAICCRTIAPGFHCFPAPFTVVRVIYMRSISN